MAFKKGNNLFDNTLNQKQQSSGQQFLSNFTNSISYTLTNTLNSKNHPSKVIHVAVVGLSGTEKEKGCLGIGKSCFCNRFVRSKSDDYNYEHISVLSQTDFSGRVVNNDHWLYWGEVVKFNNYYYENNYFNNNSNNYVNFSVIEHTEFIDDTCFQPFNTGKTESYLKRITNLKLNSPEKLMYICKNQLGIEKEYFQKNLPDGKFNIDGFICCFDVSVIQGRNLKSSIEQTAMILNSLMKTKKPIVLSTTKNDESNKFYVREIERLLQRKEYRNYNIVLVETSAHENINVDQSYFQLAQMIDKKIKSKPILSYIEALRLRKEHMNLVLQAYQSLISNRFYDYNLTWSKCCNWICNQPEYYQYCALFGKESAKQLFYGHLNNIKEQLISKKLKIYLKVLPQVFNNILSENFEEEILANNQLAINNLDELNSETLWNLIKMKLIEHQNFNHYFIINPNLTWHYADVVQRNDSNEPLIPFDLLESLEAELCFNDYRNSLKMDYKRFEMKQQFKQLLEETAYITPGKSLNEVRVFFMGRECYENLSEQNIVQIYKEYQTNITESAKSNFQELLFENLNLFYHFALKNEIITQNDLDKIIQEIKDDARYKALDNLDQERKLILLQYLSFVHNPTKENCYLYPNCIDSLIQQSLTLISRKFSFNGLNSLFSLNNKNKIDLNLIGYSDLTEGLSKALMEINSNFKKDNLRFMLDIRLINNLSDLNENFLLLNNFTIPNAGYFCIYSNANTFNFINKFIDKIYTKFHEQNELILNGLPIIVLFCPELKLSRNEIDYLKEEGQKKSKKLNAIFLDVSNLKKHKEPEKLFEKQLLEEAFKVLIDQMERRTEFLNLYVNSPNKSNSKLVKSMNRNYDNFPDIRILMCLYCGDIYSIEQLLSPFIDYNNKSNNSFKLTSPTSFTICIKIKNSVKVVEFLLTSYHGAQSYRDELLHGFFLVFSTVRKASLVTLCLFTNNIPNTPTQIYGQNIDSNLIILSENQLYFNEDIHNKLIEESSEFAEKINAHFTISSVFFDNKNEDNLNFFQNFFEEVYIRKPQIEKAFEFDFDNEKLPEKKKNYDNYPPLPIRQESHNIDKNIKQIKSKCSMESLQKEYLDEDLLSDDEDLNQDLSDEKLRINEDEEDRLYEHLPVINERIIKEQKSILKSNQNEFDLNSISTPSPGLSNYCEKMNTPSDDFEIYATIFNQKDNDHLLKPSQIKNRQLLHSESLNKSYLSSESLDHSASNNQIFKSKNSLQSSTFKHKPNSSVHHHSYSLTPPPIFQNKVNSLEKHKLFLSPTGQNRLNNQNINCKFDNYGKIDFTSNSLANLDFFHSNAKNLKPRILANNQTQTTCSNDNIHNLDEQKDHNLIYATNSHKNFTPGRSYSMLESNFQLNNANLWKQQKFITAELKEKNYLRTISKTKEINTLSKDKKNKSQEILSDNFSEEDEDTISSGLSGYGTYPPPEPAPPDKKDNSYNYSPGWKEQKQFNESFDNSQFTVNLQAQQKNNKTKPGKINLKEFDNVTNVLEKISLSKNFQQKIVNKQAVDTFAACDEIEKLKNVYGQTQNIHQFRKVKSYELDEQLANDLQISNKSNSPKNLNNSIQKKALIKKKHSSAIPVAPPSAPIAFNYDSTRQGKNGNEKEKEKIMNDLLRDVSFEKLPKSELEFKKPEKKRTKDDEKRKQAKSKKSFSKQSNNVKKDSLINFAQSEDNLVPLFLEKCIKYIEENGLDSEGLYRVPGNRVHVDLLFEKFSEDNSFDIKKYDIPVNAVTTALKEFLSKKLPSLIQFEFLEDLNEAAQDFNDKNRKINELKILFQKMEKCNFLTLKYIFKHFVRVTENSHLNSMDSKNLAICWWPTLLPFEFTDMIMFEKMRSNLEELVRFMIDHSEHIFE